MTGHSEKKSFRNFPADMFVLSGLPIGGAALFTSGLLSFSHMAIRVAVGGALCLAILGACLLFWAKLPLYREGIYFSFGSSAIPKARKVFYYWGISLTCLGCVLALMLIPFR